MKYTTPKYPTRFNILLIGLLMGSLAACTASDHTSIDTYSTDASANFSQLKTYRWDFSALGKIQPDGSHLPEFDRVVCDHVDKDLSEKGYTRVASGPADFTLDYRITITQDEAAENPVTSPNSESEANDYGLRWTFDKGESPSFKGLQAPKTQMVVYRNGTLHLAAFDKQGHVIWHSSATKILNGRANEAERRAAVRVAVNKIIRTLPVD
ncbi:MAG TPA: DUF4136 domain-containing protein [Pseudomonadales bacterium]|nr:DUF4136 domain-containing protein [Pseudomonadales bacterium]